MLSLLSLSLLAVAAPLPPPKVPEGPAPRIETIEVKEGRPYLLGKQVTFVPVTKQATVTVQEIVVVGGKPTVVAKQVPVNFTEQVPVTTPTLVPLDTKDVQVFGPDGKRLEAEEVRKQLSRPVQVLVSADGKPIHSSHLQQHPGKLQVISQMLVSAGVTKPANAPMPPAEPIKKEPRRDK
jgi:hypothetical protein